MSKVFTDTWTARELKRLYEDLWRTDYRKPARSERYYKQIELPPGTKRIIDVGIGTGRLASVYQDLGYEVYGLDIADNSLDEGIDIPVYVQPVWEKIEDRFDFSICVDVIEHIPPEYIDESISNIRGLAPHGYWLISTEPNKNLHLTVEPPEWWSNKLDWANVKSIDRGVVVKF